MSESKAKSKTRNSKKKNTKRRVKIIAPIGASGTIRRKLIYRILWTSGNATTAYNSQVFNLNSVQSVLSAGGGQPRFFDQYAAMYNKYVVHAVKANITCYSATSSQGIIFSIGAYSHNDSAQTTLTGILEQGHYSSYGLRNSLGMMTITKKFICNKIEAITKKAYDEEPNYQSTVSTNPSFIPKIEIAMSTIDAGSNVPTSVGYIGQLIYDTTFFEPKLPSAS